MHNKQRKPWTVDEERILREALNPSTGNLDRGKAHELSELFDRTPAAIYSKLYDTKRKKKECKSIPRQETTTISKLYDAMVLLVQANTILNAAVGEIEVLETWARDTVKLRDKYAKIVVDGRSGLVQQIKKEVY